MSWRRMKDLQTDIEVGRAAFGACDSADLDLFLDGELPEDRESTLFRHMSVCTGCLQYLAGILSLRSVVREEYIEVPPWADDALLSRVERLRRATRNKARLHATEPAWNASTTITVRSLLVGLGIVLLSAAVLSDLLVPPTGYVSFEQERVRIEERVPGAQSQIYVFYPGLTIEADRDPH